MLARRRDKNAFTLIELLVVIAIIALLLAVLMPSLQKVKESAMAVVCASNLRQWNIALSFYANDNNHTFPDADWDDDGDNDPRGQWWFLPLRPYYSDQPDILLCARAKKKQNVDSGADWVADGRYFPNDRNECWGRMIIDDAHEDYGEWFWCSYAPNSWLMDPSKGTWGAPLPPEAFWQRLTNVRQPSRVPYFMDSIAVDVWPHHTDEPNSQEFGTDDGRGSMRALTLLRHGTKTNIVFMDGSSRKVDIKELWQFKWHRQFNCNNPYTETDAPWPSWMR